jgi:predicted methyltransferase
MKKTIWLAAAATLLSGAAYAHDHGTSKGKDTAAHAKLQKAHQQRLAQILADPSRAEDAKRDKYRHPAETLEFFRVHPDHKIGEYAPGGEWVSRLLGRYVDGPGKLVGLYFNPAGFADPKWQEGIRAGAASYAADVAKVTGRPATDYAAFTLGDIPEGQKGTFDRILIMRMMHNINRWNIADSELKAMRDLLKDDGLVGIEQHRAKADAPYSYTDGSKGYMREADVIKMMEINGFELVGKSEVNANPKDSANWPDGVWTLPPVLAKKDVDRAKYEAIGETDRMTLLFKKRL